METGPSSFKLNGTNNTKMSDIVNKLATSKANFFNTIVERLPNELLIDLYKESLFGQPDKIVIEQKKKI